MSINTATDEYLPAHQPRTDYKLGCGYDPIPLRGRANLGGRTVPQCGFCRKYTITHRGEWICGLLYKRPTH